MAKQEVIITHWTSKEGPVHCGRENIIKESVFVEDISCVRCLVKGDGLRGSNCSQSERKLAWNTRND